MLAVTEKAPVHPKQSSSRTKRTAHWDKIGAQNAQTDWTEEDEQLLLDLMVENRATSFLAARLRRTEAAIIYRISKLRREGRAPKLYSLGRVSAMLGMAVNSESTKRLTQAVKEGALEATPRQLKTRGKEKRLYYYVTMHSIRTFMRHPDYWRWWDPHAITDRRLRDEGFLIRGLRDSYTAYQVTRRYGIPYQTLWREANKGLHVEKIGRLRYYRAADVENHDWSACILTHRGPGTIFLRRPPHKIRGDNDRSQRKATNPRESTQRVVEAKPR